MSPVLAIVAARDEEERIAQTILGLQRLAEDLGVLVDVLVVDDASSDRTGLVARRAGARVVRPLGHLGKGGALEFALNEEGIGEFAGDQVVLFVDADLGATASALGPVLAPVAQGRVQAAIAVLPTQGGGFGLVKRAARRAIRVLGGREMQEPLSGQRALTSAALASARPLASGFGVETAMTIDILRAGFTLTEVPVPVRHRATGRDVAGFIHRGRQGWDISRAVWKRALH